MIIDISYLKDGAKKFDSEGVEVHAVDDNGSLAGLMRSPNHPLMPYNSDRNFGFRIKDYLNYYVNDSVILIDRKQKKLILGRDWPGNVMIYYWIKESPDGIRFLAADNIIELSKKIESIEFSYKGVQQYLKDRKYYQSFTALEGVRIIQPGFCLVLDLSSGSISFDAWYSFHNNILISNPTKAVLAIRRTLDESIERLVSKDDEIALMYSGGSDSTLLLDRLVNLGYTNLSLYNVSIKGRNSERKRAEKAAVFYGFKVNQIDVERDEAIHNWMEAISISYIGRAYARINGWLSMLPSLYRHLNEKYSGVRINVMWGFVHPFMLNNFRFSRVPFVYLAFILLKKMKPLIERHPEAALKTLETVLGKIVFLENDNHTEEENAVFKKTIIDMVSKVNHPDELINMKLMMGLTNQKVWTMNRQKTIAEAYCPQARNVFPFVDRKVQETAASISLKARFGGVFKWARVSDMSRKFLTLNAFESKIPREYILGGNYESRPDWQSLYKNEYFYSRAKEIIDDIKSDEQLSAILKENAVVLPETEEEYENMRYRDIEIMMSALMLEKCFTSRRAN